MKRLEKDLESLRDSIETSVSINLFKTYEKSYEYHITKTKKVKLDLLLFKKGKINNFNPDRLKGKKITDAYPLQNRPRGIKDITSVRYHIKQIKNKNYPYIWIAKKNNKFILLDGVHCVVAYHISNKGKIPAYVIYI